LSGNEKRRQIRREREMKERREEFDDKKKQEEEDIRLRANNIEDPSQMLVLYNFVIWHKLALCDRYQLFCKFFFHKCLFVF